MTPEELIKKRTRRIRMQRELDAERDFKLRWKHHYQFQNIRPLGYYLRRWKLVAGAAYHIAVWWNVDTKYHPGESLAVYFPLSEYHSFYRWCIRIYTKPQLTRWWEALLIRLIYALYGSSLGYRGETGADE